MSLKSGVLFSLFSGVSFTDLQRATSGRGTKIHTPREAVAHATRFAGVTQISTASTHDGVTPSGRFPRCTEAA